MTLMNNGTFLTTLLMYPLIFYPTFFLILEKMKGTTYDIITGELIVDYDSPWV